MYGHNHHPLPPSSTCCTFEFGSFKFSSFLGPKLSSNASAWFDVQNFFDKTKSAIVSFFSLTKLKTRPFLLSHSVEWTVYLKSPLYQKIKHMYSAGKTWHFWFKFSSPRAQMTSNAWHPPTWLEGGGGFKLQIDWHIYCMLETNIRESKLHVIIKALEN